MEATDIYREFTQGRKAPLQAGSVAITPCGIKYSSEHNLATFKIGANY